MSRGGFNGRAMRTLRSKPNLWIVEINEAHNRIWTRAGDAGCWFGESAWPNKRFTFSQHCSQIIYVITICWLMCLNEKRRCNAFYIEHVSNNQEEGLILSTGLVTSNLISSSWRVSRISLYLQLLSNLLFIVCSNAAVRWLEQNLALFFTPYMRLFILEVGRPV